MLETIGKYRVVKKLGKGATSEVYLAKDPADDKDVAIKLVTIGADESMLSRRLKKLFMVEARLAGKLKHPNITQIYETVVEEKQTYVVMEYVKGSTLEEFCDIEQLLPMHQVIGIIFKCCLALDYAYRNGVIHRDIKPANILLVPGDEPEPKILDFGLALTMGEKQTDSTFISGIGSPSYMSPEQVKDHPLNHQTDLYSMGVVLYQLLTGRLPFRAHNPAALIYKIINAEPALPSAFRSGIPPNLDKIVKRSLEKDLYSRYHNGAEFAQDLTAVRYQLVSEGDSHAHDLVKFKLLRSLAFFKHFEDPEIWEVLRISVLDKQAADTVLLQEGETSEVFYILVQGQVRITFQGKLVSILTTGESIGEIAYLNQKDPRHIATATSMTPVGLLKINKAALALASEECHESFRKAFNSILIKKLTAMNQLIHKLSTAPGSNVEAMLPSLLEPPPEVTPAHDIESMVQGEQAVQSALDKLVAPSFTLIPMDGEAPPPKPSSSDNKKQK